MALSIDIAELVKPLTMTAPDLGDLLVDVHGGLQDWLTQGLDSGRWSDGRDLTRDLLLEQTRRPADEPLDPAVIDALDAPLLDGAAAALLAVSGHALRPHWIQDETRRHRRRARKRRNGEAYDLDLRDGETECDRLYRLARDWREDCRLRDEELRAMMLGPTWEELTAATYRAHEMDDWRRAAGLLDSSRSFLDAVNGARALDPAATNVASAVARAMDPYALATAPHGRRSLDASSLIADQALFHDHMAAHRSFVEMAYPQALTISQEIDRLTRLNSPTYDALSGALRAQAQSIDAALALAMRPAGPDLVGVLAEPRTYFDELRRQLRVDRPASGLAGLAAASPELDLRQVMGEVTALRPGYQTAAALGLTGAAARGVVADLLCNYDLEPAAKAPVFAAAVRTAHAADVPGRGVEDIEALWARVVDLEAEVRETPNPLVRQGRHEILVLILTLLGVLLGAAQLGVAVADYRVGEAERRSDAAQEERRALFEARVLAAQAQIRADAVERDRTTRFIAADGPLRLEPHAQAAVLQHVFAGQMARAKDQRGGWVLVEVFSYAPETSVTGWLPARRLRARP